MKYENLNLKDKAKYFFDKFKLDFDNWKCSSEETKSICESNRMTLLKLKYLPENESVADIYSKLCNDYAEITKSQ
tara:strand:+ start:15692 stop:15916 length:225 start_codon:yes stop_codon:yes gene_type:complete